MTTVDHTCEEHPDPTGVGSRFDWERALAESGQGVRVVGLGLLLASYGMDDGTCIHPGNARMASECGQGKASTARSLALLKQRGWIAVAHEATARQPTVYRLALPVSAA